ncbi:hypothetical protein SAMN04488127_2886 [Bhargavaea ginsengi]|uniref:Uncharacterized protein n=1 Tax=Bhargavaea ginsengi TaxID=426757 RepID=A0A1H7BT50_9BACL|nr:hypothetical protein SAMN04488127_2886 [Bhargavaea ginsengi]
MGTPLSGKVNAGLGIVSLIIGLIMFISRFDGSFIFGDQLLSLSFVSLGLALFCASYINKKNTES